MGSEIEKAGSLPTTTPSVAPISVSNNKTKRTSGGRDVKIKPKPTRMIFLAKDSKKIAKTAAKKLGDYRVINIEKTKSIINNRLNHMNELSQDGVNIKEFLKKNHKELEISLFSNLRGEKDKLIKDSFNDRAAQSNIKRTSKAISSSALDSIARKDAVDVINILIEKSSTTEQYCYMYSFLNHLKSKKAINESEYKSLKKNLKDKASNELIPSLEQPEELYNAYTFFTKAKHNGIIGKGLYSRLETKFDKRIITRFRQLTKRLSGSDIKEYSDNVKNLMFLIKIMPKKVADDEFKAINQYVPNYFESFSLIFIKDISKKQSKLEDNLKLYESTKEHAMSTLETAFKIKYDLKTINYEHKQFIKNDDKVLDEKTANVFMTAISSIVEACNEIPIVIERISVESTTKKSEGDAKPLAPPLPSTPPPSRTHRSNLVPRPARKAPLPPTTAVGINLSAPTQHTSEKTTRPSAVPPPPPIPDSLSKPLQQQEAKLELKQAEGISPEVIRSVKLKHISKEEIEISKKLKKESRENHMFGGGTLSKALAKRRQQIGSDDDDDDDDDENDDVSKQSTDL